MTIPDCEKQMDDTKEKKIPLCKKKKVLEAINVLKELNKKFIEDETKKQPLLEEAADSPILLQVTMKKIPPKRMGKRIKVSLPHAMMLDTTEVCLFTGDLDKRNKKAEIDPDVLHYKELLKKQGITNITEVITLRQLRTEYKVYEARRQLMAAYDVFLCDKKIAQCLPRLLGTTFIKKRKFPLQINMDTPHLKNQVDKALSETVFAVNCRGNSCTSEVARLGMEDDAILENVLASVKVLGAELPGEQENICGIYIKTARSQAIPIFMSFGNPNEVKIKQVHVRENVDLEELSTLPDTKVKVFRDGRIIVQRDQARKDENSTKIAKGSKSQLRKKNNKEGLTEGNSEAEASTQSEEESEPTVKITEEDSNEIKTKKLKRKGKKNTTERNVKIETSIKNEELEEIEEEDTNTSKAKKRKSKGQGNTTEKKLKIETSIKNEELEEIEEEDTNKSKTKKQSRKRESKKNFTETEASIPSEEPVFEIIEDNANKTKTKKRNEQNRKRKAPEALEHETLVPKVQKIKTVKKRQTRVKS